MKKIKQTVENILNNEPYARQNDGYLIRRVVETLEPNLYKKDFKNIMDNLPFYSISCETIVRVKRDFFTKNPELVPEKVEKARRKKEQEYRKEYSNHIPTIKEERKCLIKKIMLLSKIKISEKFKNTPPKKNKIAREESTSINI